MIVSPLVYTSRFACRGRQYLNSLSRHKLRSSYQNFVKSWFISSSFWWDLSNIYLMIVLAHLVSSQRFSSCCPYSSLLVNLKLILHMNCQNFASTLFSVQNRIQFCSVLCLPLIFFQSWPRWPKYCSKVILSNDLLLSKYLLYLSGN